MLHSNKLHQQHLYPHRQGGPKTVAHYSIHHIFGTKITLNRFHRNAPSF